MKRYLLQIRIAAEDFSASLSQCRCPNYNPLKLRFHSSSSETQLPNQIAHEIVRHSHHDTAASSLEMDSSGREVKGVSSILDSNINSNETTTGIGIDLDHKTVRETIYTTYGNDWKRALEFFHWVEENDSRFHHDIHTCNTIIDILGKFFEFDLAWDLIHRMNSHSPPDHTTFRVMFKRYVSAHMVQEAIDTFNNRIQEFHLKDFISFSNLIDSLCEYKHVIEAQELLSSSPLMANIYQTNSNKTKLYNMILRGWSKVGWWSKCREFWEEMDHEGVVRDVHSYSVYMDILCKSGKPWKAVKLYKELKKMKRIRLDVVAYNTVVHALGLSEGVDESIRVFREMLELGFKPNIVTYNTIIKLLCKDGRVKEAYSLFDKMHERGVAPDVITYQCFFGCLNNPKEILKLFDVMLENGIRPRMDTFVMLLRKFGRWGFLRPVFLVWNKMEELGFSPNEFAYNALIDALIQKGMIDMARKYDNEMLEKGLSAKPHKELGTSANLMS